MPGDDLEGHADADPAATVVPTVPDELTAMLDLLAETIVQALGFGVAVVNIARPDGSLEVVSVAGDDNARRTLLGTVECAQIWDDMLSMSEPWGLLRFADHLNEDAYLETLTWIPDMVPIDADDAWHPEDALFAPLTARDGTRLGILSVDLPRDGHRPDSIICRALEAFAVSAALAIEHASLRSRAEASERRFKELASRDQLTGVGTRSVLLDRLEHAVAVRPGHRSLLAVVFVDIDRFKSINDDHSHQVGDQVLQTVARRIQALVRPHDTVARWGGDEFLILLEHLEDEAAGVRVARRITAAVVEPLRQLGPDLGVTASVGVAFHRADCELTVDEIVHRADAAMYLVKRNGGNACAVYDRVDKPGSAPALIT